VEGVDIMVSSTVQVNRVVVTPLANAITAVAIVAYVLCRIVSLIFPDALAAVARSWFHGLAVGTAPRPGFDTGEFVLGLVSFAVVTWLISAAAAWLYNALAGRP